VKIWGRERGGECGWWLSAAQTADKVDDTGESCICLLLFIFGAVAAQVGGGYYIKKLLLPFQMCDIFYRLFVLFKKFI
jgi:hypothetical protein